MQLTESFSGAADLSGADPATILSRLAEADTDPCRLANVDGFRTGIERRRHVRLRTEEPVRVRVLGGVPPEADAQITDVSPKGVCLRMHGELPLGAGVLLLSEGGYLLGTVRNHRRAGLAWLVGVELEPLGTNAGVIASIWAARRRKLSNLFTQPN